MEIYKLTREDIKRPDVDVVAALMFGNYRAESKEKARVFVVTGFDRRAESCSNIVTDAIAGCV